MKNQLISEITRQMIPYLDNAQMEQLQEVLQHTFWNVQITANENVDNIRRILSSFFAWL